MNRCDFKFRGETLSSHGFVLCHFDSSTSLSAVNTDSQRDISSIRMHGGKSYPIISSVYNGAFVAEMSICKIDESTDMIVSPGEIKDIKRWLGSPTPEVFRLCDSAHINVFWNGVFNIEEVHLNDDCVGFNLKFTATSPFGYKDTIVTKGSVTQGSFINIYDTSDDEGYIYPDVSITVKSPGDLRIVNSFDGRETLVKNCTSGETITFSHLLQVTSSNKSHMLGDDFNFKFIRICNTYSDITNKLTFSLPCDYTISYNPIAKVVI